MKVKVTVVLACLHWLCGCALFQQAITYFDPTTYKNLTDLKPEVIMLYESFGGETIDTVWVRHVRLKLAQAHEYERGKGPKNKETAAQIDIIRKMFDRHCDERRREGPWNEAHTMNSIENIEEAFDIAIETERLKNKNEER